MMVRPQRDTSSPPRRGCPRRVRSYGPQRDAPACRRDLAGLRGLRLDRRRDRLPTPGSASPCCRPQNNDYPLMQGMFLIITVSVLAGSWWTCCGVRSPHPSARLRSSHVRTAARAPRAALRRHATSLIGVGLVVAIGVQCSPPSSSCRSAGHLQLRLPALGQHWLGTTVPGRTSRPPRLTTRLAHGGVIVAVLALFLSAFFGISADTWGLGRRGVLPVRNVVLPARPAADDRHRLLRAARTADRRDLRTSWAGGQVCVADPCTRDYVQAGRSRRQLIAVRSCRTCCR